MTEEMTTQKKYTNWNVWCDGVKKNLITLVPMTTEDALKHFKATAVQGLDEEFVGHFGQYVNRAEAKCS